MIISARFKISPNDAIACVISIRKNIKELYSFDKHFDNIPFLKRITSPNLSSNEESAKKLLTFYKLLFNIYNISYFFI
jgi:hypothetical protein